MTAIIILYNTDRFITEQIRLLQKYVTDKIAVVDNSSDLTVASKVKAICEENKVDYLKVFCEESDFSKSHAYAATTAIGMYRDEDESILLLDHDIFPIKQYEPPEDSKILAGIPQIRKSPIGVTDTNNQRYLFTYLWPGLLWINTGLLQGKEIDIKPCEVAETNLDTGGGLYKLIMGNPAMILYYSEQHQVFDGEDNYSLIEGTWMHFRNGSNWKGEGNHEERINKLMSILYANS